MTEHVMEASDGVEVPPSTAASEPEELQTPKPKRISYVEPESIEDEEGDLEDNTGGELQPTVGQDKIQLLTKDVNTSSSVSKSSKMNALCF